MIKMNVLINAKIILFIVMSIIIFVIKNVLVELFMIKKKKFV